MPTKAEIEEELRFLKVELDIEKATTKGLEEDLDKIEKDGYANEERMNDMEAFIEWARPYVQNMAQDAITAGSVGDANMIRDLANVF
jgi:hypothetical protein